MTGDRARFVRCPRGCDLHIKADLAYRPLRTACRNHLERAHGASGEELSAALRAMLGDRYHASPEYELDNLPVWPEVVTVQLGDEEP